MERIYAGLKLQIASENGGHANEKFMWHGTGNEEHVRNGIAYRGFDNRFWTQGVFGFGGYFAENIDKSHYFASGHHVKLMFYCKVLAGNEQRVTEAAASRNTLKPDQGYHTILGLDHGPCSNTRENIIFRYRQAMALFQIEYS